MATQTKINCYMERHRIGPLFEDLMNRVLRDMPEEPMVYLLRTIYKKAGMEIPQNVRYGGLRKSMVDIPRGSSPERPSRSAQVSSSADVSGSRDYDRPWAVSPTRKSKSKKVDEAHKNKPEWNMNNKLKQMSSFDEFWEGADAVSGKKERAKVTSSSGLRMSKQERSPAANAWASVGLEDQGDHYSSPPYNGPNSRLSRSHKMTEEELLASEMLTSSKRSQGQQLETNGTHIPSSISSQSRKKDLREHRNQLGQMLQDTGSGNDSGLGGFDDDDDDDDAIEMLENAEDLQREGVVNIPKSGYKLSRNLRHRDNEPRVKLNINVNPDRLESCEGTPSLFNTPAATPRSSPEQPDFDEDNEEFESVSQVTGPRQPVWNLPGSKKESQPGTSIPLRPAVSRDTPSQHCKRTADKKMYATTPQPELDRSVQDPDELSASAKTWTVGENRVSFDDSPEDPVPSNRTRLSEASSGGWHIPDDTDIASGFDWDQRVKGGPPRDPRVY